MVHAIDIVIFTIQFVDEMDWLRWVNLKENEQKKYLSQISIIMNGILIGYGV